MSSVSCLERIRQFRVEIKHYKHTGEQSEIQEYYSPGSQPALDPNNLTLKIVTRTQCGFIPSSALNFQNK